MSHCKIRLFNYLGSYKPSDNITGYVECNFDDLTTIRGIKIQLKGTEDNEWTETEEYLDPADNQRKSRYIQCTGNKTFSFIEQYLVGSSAGTIEMPPQKYVYNFTFVLPPKMPATFDGDYGKISYCLKAIVDRPMRLDYEFKLPFIVESPIDASELPVELDLSSAYSDENVLSCCCTKSGTVTMNAEIERLIFVPGNPVKLKVTIVNLSRENVKKLRVNLIQIITYRVESPRSDFKENSENLLNVTEHGVGAHGEHCYNLQLELPAHTKIVNFDNCSLYKVTYKLTIEAKLPKCHSNLYVEMRPRLATTANNRTVGKPADNNGAPPPSFDSIYPPTSFGFVVPTGAGDNNYNPTPNLLPSAPPAFMPPPILPDIPPNYQQIRSEK